MAKALVAFYPLAGRVGVDGDGRAEIDCAGQGALFVVAHSDLAVDEDDLSNFQPSPELRRLFVPRVEPSVMCAVKVTFLRCGSVVLGAALHHAAVDAISAFHFFQTWSAFSSESDGDGAAAKLPWPCHDRTLLRARSPPAVHPDALDVFCPNPSRSRGPGAAVVNNIFVFSKDQVSALKQRAGNVSTFCAVSAHVWRCLCAARQLPPDATTRLTFPANVRRRLRPPLPDAYFGNGFILLGAAGKVRDIASPGSELASVAGRIGCAVRRMDDELVRSAVDYLELEACGGGLPEAAVHTGSLAETEVMVVSWRGMPVYDADFGLGKPLVMHRAVQPHAGFVCLMDGVVGSVRILVSTEATVRDDFHRLLYDPYF